MRRIAQYLWLVLVVAACSPSTGPASVTVTAVPSKPTPMLLPRLAPTPVLAPAAEFVSGITAQEPGTYLFIESWSHDDGLAGCEEWILIDEPTYDYACDGGCPWEWGPGEPDRAIVNVDSFYWAEEPEPALLIGLHGTGSSISGIGGGVASVLYPINGLPYQLAKDKILHSVAGDGSIVVQIGPDYFILQPGQSWISRQYADEAWVRRWYSGTPPANCSVILTRRLTNFGLMSPGQLDVGLELGPHLALTPTPVPPPSACTVYPPLGTEGWVWDIAVGPTGQVWVASNLGVARFDPLTESWTPFTAANGLVAGAIRAVAIEESGVVWAAAWDGGLASFDGSRWQVVPDDDWPAKAVKLVRVAPDGALWFSAADGIYEWDRVVNAWRQHDQADGLHKNRGEDILFTPDGTVWVTHYGAVSYRPPGSDSWLVQPLSERARQNHMNGYDTATVAADGRIWFSGQRFYDPATGQWTETVYGGSVRGFAYAVLVDANGGLWIARGDDQGLIHIADPLADKAAGSWRRFTTKYGLAGNDVRSLAFGADETIWLGSENGRVSRCHIPTLLGP